MTAKFINIKNNINEYICNICSDKIDDDKIVSLKCDPTRHIFCYDCILDWYKQLKKKNNMGNYNIKNMCPICRENGGLLPIYNNDIPIKNIHNMKTISIKNINNFEINPNKKFFECGFKLKSKNGYCCAYGHGIYQGLCGIHVKYIPKNINNVNKIVLNPNKKENECGVKFKSKNGYCCSLSKEIYGGFCGLHKLKNINNNSDEEVLII
jgi:hypothetical protein